MSLIRKHAALWALLSCFALAAAAPYLIPANPDSAVFRSGTLGMMLELGACLTEEGCVEDAQDSCCTLHNVPVCGQAPWPDGDGLSDGLDDEAV